MAKNQNSMRSAVTGKFVTKPIGSGKSTKFSAVEGQKLSGKSKSVAANALSSGLRGDAYRSAVTKSFKKK